MSARMELVQSSLQIDSSFAKTKRLLDISFTLAISPALLLISIAIVLVIRLDSKGAVIFRQKRIGINGNEFNMLKFRTMYENSDSSVHHEAIMKYLNGDTLNESIVSPYKLTNDSRITRVGRFLRKASLDELPQFWNILRGEMSLVGPRPPLPFEVELYSTRDLLRLSGKPGLTGAWQVFGRNRVTFQQMVEMDIEYLQRQSIVEDIKLITRTLPVMFQGRGE